MINKYNFLKCFLKLIFIFLFPSKYSLLKLNFETLLDNKYKFIYHKKSLLNKKNKKIIISHYID